MSSELWLVKTHVVPASHMRGVARGARDEYSGRPLRMEVKQYLPKSNPSPQAGDVSLIMAHGIASAKECFEPLFDELLRHLERSAVRIRSIWAVDAASNGKSYLLNKDDIGDEVDWLDFPRDISHMVNHFQTQMPPPIIGIGQSLGAGSIFLASSWNARLFAGIVALEPALGPDRNAKWPFPPKLFPGVAAARRKDRWPSRDAARREYTRSKHYGAFDARVLEKVLEHELSDVLDLTSSTASTSSPPAVTLTTPRSLESAAWMLPDPPFPRDAAHADDDVERSRAELIPGFYQPGGPRFYECLPRVHPPVLLVWGGASPLTPRARREYFARTVGSGGGGCGRRGVREARVKGAGHMVSLEKPGETAEVVAGWLGERWGEWQREVEGSRGRKYSRDARKEWLERIDRVAKL